MFNKRSTKSNKGKESKVKDNKEKNIVDTYLSMSDAGQPTQEKVAHKVFFYFFDDEKKNTY